MVRVTVTDVPTSVQWNKQANLSELRRLYGDEHVDRPLNITAPSSPNMRDNRDPEEIGNRIIRSKIHYPQQRGIVPSHPSIPRFPDLGAHEVNGHKVEE
jgi:hypothetical protein